MTYILLYIYTLIYILLYIISIPINLDNVVDALKCRARRKFLEEYPKYFVTLNLVT